MENRSLYRKMDEVKYEFYFNQKLTKEEPVKTVVAGFWLIKGGKKYKIRNGYLDWDEYKKNKGGENLMTFKNELIGMPDEVDESNFIMYNEKDFRKLRLFKALVAFNNDSIRTIAYKNNLDPIDFKEVIKGKTWFKSIYTRVINDYISDNLKGLIEASNREKKVSKFKSYLISIKRWFDICHYKYVKKGGKILCH